jgi:hypothetical protein
MDINRIMIQPPVSFYLALIEKFKFQDIVVVTQGDFKNPCINELKKAIQYIRIKTASLVDDISAILSAKNLVIANSTFSLCFGLVSAK